ncbi:MAG: radical SAM protein [Luteitalea sp.]|nr:radical SAM protein [Luteitalea sp.]
MQASIFNLRVPLPGDDVFLMNTLTDAQIIVSSDVAALLDRGGDDSALDQEARQAFRQLEENGFLVPSRDHDRQGLNDYLAGVKSSRTELNVTVLTTLQCNFACDYCYQGDHGDYNKFADKMSLETAARIATWIEREMDRVNPEKFVLTFFGGEPLLNLPVLYYLAERLWQASERRRLPQMLTIITNGLLLTEAVVERLLPFGLRGVKITLDGDKETHDRMRPLRGGQGTFDRIIENIRRIAGRCKIAIGGNFDESSVESFPALLEFLRTQEFADQLVKVNFKPVVRPGQAQPLPGASRPSLAADGAGARTTLALTPVAADGSPLKPLNGTCMTSTGAGIGATCDSCDFLDDKMAFLRDETRRHGFPTPDGVHNGPCHVHHTHAHTIGPDGSLYACPGFTGEKGLSTGHVDDRLDPLRQAARQQFDRLSPWNACGDCAFIPVCAGGCIAASHATLGDMNTPACHKRAYESAVISLAHQSAGAS